MVSSVKSEDEVRQEVRQRESLIKCTARALGISVVRTGGKVERKEDHLVAELGYQPNVVWVLEFPVKLIILVKGEEWQGFLPLWDDEFELGEAVQSFSDDLVYMLRPRDPKGKAILPLESLSKSNLQELIGRLRQEGFTLAQ